MDREMDKPFTHDFHYLAALIQHLGAHEKWNSRTPRNISQSLGMSFENIERVLSAYPAFFRKSSNLSSQNEPLYTVHLRYARRRKNENSGQYESPPITPEELSMLLGLVTQMISVEGQDERLKAELRQNNIKIWIASGAAVASAVTAVIVAFITNS